MHLYYTHCSFAQEQARTVCLYGAHADVAHLPVVRIACMHISNKEPNPTKISLGACRSLCMNHGSVTCTVSKHLCICALIFIRPHRWEMRKYAKEKRQPRSLPVGLRSIPIFYVVFLSDAKQRGRMPGGRPGRLFLGQDSSIFPRAIPPHLDE